MELKNEPRLGLELRLQRLVIVTSLFAVLVTISIFAYTNLASHSDSLAGTQSTSNTITGNVFCDLDQDGSKDNFENNLENVKVWLYNDANGNGQIDATEGIIDSTTTDSDGDYAFTPNYSAGSGSVTVSVSNDNDDADEKGNGKVYRGSNYLRLNNRTVALRFQNVNIPQGTTISNASVTMNSWTSNGNSCSVDIYADDVDNSASISSSNDDITDRTLTTTKVQWSLGSWSYDQDYSTPDIKSVIQEIVNRPNWQSGNDITLIFKKASGSSNTTKKVTSRDYSSQYAPELSVTYSSGSSNQSSSYVIKVDTNSYSGAMATTNDELAVTFNSGGNTDSDNDFGIANACGDQGNNLVQGALFNDANQNGTLDNGESSQPNAKVYLYKDVNGNGVIDNDDEIVDSTTTNSAGKYQFVVDYSNTSNSSGSIQKRISNGDHDVEEDDDEMDLDDDDLDFNENWVGLLYTDIAIPQRASITSAYFRFKAEDNSSSSSGSVRIYGEDTDNPAYYSDDDEDLSGRTRTSNYETWSMPRFYSNQFYNSADIKDVVQEIVDRSGWSSGNRMNFIFKPHSGEDRDALSYDDASSTAPELFITYASNDTSGNKYLVMIDSTSGNIQDVTTDCVIDCEFTNSGQKTEEFASGVFDPSTLPVEFLYFKATLENGITQLNWATAMEENNSHFEVERSTDGYTFIKISEVAGNGNSQSVIEYEYLDSEFPSTNGPVYYRLKQVDYDGNYDYSPVVYVQEGMENNAKAYPNPCNNFLNVSKAGHRFNVSLFDQSGNIVAYREMQTGNTQINTSDMPNGFYVLRVESREGEESIKILVRH